MGTPPSGQSPSRAAEETGVSRAPRVVHLVESLDVGGLEQLVIDLTTARAPAPTSVTCLRSLGALAASRSHGAEWTVIGMERGPLTALSRLCRHFVRSRVEVVHCHNMLAHAYGGMAALLTGGRGVVLTKHGTVMPTRGFAAAVGRRLARRTHAVAVSEDVRSAMTVNRWFEHGAVRVIPNGISLARFRPVESKAAARRTAGLSEGGVILGIVARLAKEKEHVLLVRAFEKVAAAVPEASLLIVGDGPERPEIEHAVKLSPVRDRITLTGARHDVPAVLAALDVFVLPSNNEGLPLAVLEAMAAGVPVVATRVGGVPDAVVDGVTGLLVPRGDEAALAESLACLARDEGRRNVMGSAGRAQVERRFGVSRVVADYEGVYRAAAGA